jgi:hypothetical protein
MREDDPHVSGKGRGTAGGCWSAGLVGRMPHAKSGDQILLAVCHASPLHSSWVSFLICNVQELNCTSRRVAQRSHVVARRHWFDIFEAILTMFPAKRTYRILIQAHAQGEINKESL